MAVSLDLLPDLPPALFPITKGAAEDDAEVLAEADEVTLPEPPSSRPFPTGRSPEGVGVAEAGSIHNNSNNSNMRARVWKN